jgi:hypothetical protein
MGINPMAAKEEKREKKKLKGHPNRFLHHSQKLFRSFLFPPCFGTEKFSISHGYGLSHLSSVR